MSKRNALILAVLVMFTSYGAANAIPSAFGYDLEADMHRTERKQQQMQQQQAQAAETPDEEVSEEEQAEGTKNDFTFKTAKDMYSFVPMADLYVPNIDNKVYYSNPTMKSAIYKYKKGNYTGSLQELYAYIKKKSNDPYAFYYMGLNYTKIGESKAAANCFQKVINCNAKGQLLAMAVKGRDCINGGIYCTTPFYPSENDIYSGYDSLDQFIAAPYSGNGFSPEAKKAYEQKKVDIQRKKLNQSQQEKSNNQSAIPVFEKIAMAADITTAEPTNEEVLNAIDVLKRAGLNITTGSTTSATETTSDVVSEKKNQPSFINPEYEAINMMMGNNSNNNDPMTSMLPYMLNSNENGKNIDPQVIQAVMMNSMMSSLNGLNSTDNDK